MPEKQLFEIEKIDDAYLILWNNEYALSCEEDKITWEKLNYGDFQLWQIESVQ